MKTLFETLTSNQKEIIRKIFDGYQLYHHRVVGPYLLKDGHCINVHRNSADGLGKKKIIQWEDRSKMLVMIDPNLVDELKTDMQKYDSKKRTRK